jgi:hypothetical protein
VNYYLINIFGLDEDKEEESLGGVYDALDNMGESSIYYGGFILATKLNLNKVFKVLDKYTNIVDYINVKQITDIEKQISNIHIIDWINKIDFIERSKVVEKEYEDKLNAMNDILNSAKKILERGSEGEPKDSK